MQNNSGESSVYKKENHTERVNVADLDSKRLYD